jgi:lipoyl(octanoyl) transferase
MENEAQEKISKKIRILRTGRRSGAFNMALDEALWQNFARAKQNGEHPMPILRLYGWEPAALSLGYAQRAEREVYFAACERLGISWVRRPTGGRAILHEATELTYSFVSAIEDERFGGSVLESYRKLSGALVGGLEKLGVGAQLAGKDKRGEDGDNTAACFDAPSAYEVTVGGRKIIGSAQARRESALLQQGTILLEVDVPKLFEVLKPPLRMSREQAIEQVGSRLTAINPVAGRTVSFEEAEAAFALAFVEHFGLTGIEDIPDAAELALAHDLEAAKYANPAWNLERQRPIPAFR